MDEEFRRAAEFHGHYCPGLAMGYRVARYVKDYYDKAEDEELVAIVENDSCSVDAIQYVLSCTFGKGNLIFMDHGKHVYTFYSRDHKKALRIYFKGRSISQSEIEAMRRYFAGRLTEEEQKEVEKMREDYMEYILGAGDDELFEVREVDLPAPEKARIYPSMRCEECGEDFMEIKGRTAEGKVVCKDCYGKMVG